MSLGETKFEIYIPSLQPIKHLIPKNIKPRLPSMEDIEENGNENIQSTSDSEDWFQCYN